MTYTEAIDLLYQQFVSFHKEGKKAFSGKLEPIQKLCDELNNPQNKYPVIHVAGTNGKGSTCAVIASLLKQHGLKVGLYSSPHLYDFRERIRVNGEMISKEKVSFYTQELMSLSKDLPLSFFEITTAMAFLYFHEEKVDVAVIETGLGGRLDATNINENKMAAVITPIGLDHVDILGNNIEEIAREKAGIVPKANFCFNSSQNTHLSSILDNVCNKNGVKFTQLKAPKSKYKSDLNGSFQQNNIHLAVETVKHIASEFGLKYDVNLAQKALLSITKNSGLRGRFEKVSTQPDIYFDVAHNEQGIISLFDEIKAMNYNKVHWVCAFSKDKDLKSIFKHFVKTSKHQYYLTTTGTERGIVKEQYEELMRSLGEKTTYFEHPNKAFEKAKKRASPNEVIVVFGSFFLFETIQL